MKRSELTKDVLAVIAPPIWDPYHYVSVLTRKAYEKNLPALLEHGKKYDVVDYGCGARPYEHLFEDHINNYTGIDVGDNPKADIKIQPGESLKIVSSSADFVLSSQVLEHVKEVDQYMNECYRILRPGGYLLLSTHGTWQYHASPYDFNRWTCIGLKTLIEKYDFDILKTIPVLGQFALTSQLRLSFYNSVANMIGPVGRILLAPVSLVYQFKMMLEDMVTPQRVKDRDSAIFLMVAKKKQVQNI
jgi:SAM-dependent methyltransferase